MRREKPSTVGGSTSGNATTAATASFHRAFERASHHATGVPTMSRRTVVIDASASVSRMGDQRSSDPSMHNPVDLALLRPVSELLDHRRCFRTFQERHERPCRLVAGAILQKHSILADGSVKICRNDPTGSTLPFDDLRQRNESELGVFCIHELESLRDVAALHDLAGELLVDAENLHGFNGGGAPRGRGGGWGGGFC